MDPEARRYMWSVIHRMSTKGLKSSVIMTTHSMDEAETLCKRIAIMVNGEFVCFGKANQIKEKYGYGYEANVRVKPLSEKQFNDMLNKYHLDKYLLIDINNVNEILKKIDRKYYIDELNDGRLGQRIKRDIVLNGNINIRVLLSWVFFVENAIRFIMKGKKYFEEIILPEYIENNFLFKMKKSKNNNNSIGFFFGLYEESKEECFITEYSIQQTSLEQIFNKFSVNQGKNINKNQEQKKEDENNDYVIIDDVLCDKLIKT
jgi:ATP-binding cassette subfamily A (ABC1) protein 3